MQDFFQRYFDKLDLTTMLENLLTKVISLLILFLLFYIAKKMLHATVRKIVKPSLKFSNRDAGRQKTISRLLENVFNLSLIHIYRSLTSQDQIRSAHGVLLETLAILYAFPQSTHLRFQRGVGLVLGSSGSQQRLP